MQSQEIISTIGSIYKKYAIPLNVQRHMKEVTAVAEMICDNSKIKVNKEDVVASCLIHDLGNIIKMDFESEESISLGEIEDRVKVEFYKKKQKEMVQKYGANAEKADLLIAKELGASERVLELISHKAIHIEDEKFVSSDLEEIIAAYADMRVSPHGIVSMHQRLDEYRKRYKLHENKEQIEHSKKFALLSEKMENELFSKVLIKPEDITNLSAKKYIEKYGKVK